MTQPSPVRPITVTVSACLLSGAAILTVLDAASSLWNYYMWVDAYENAVADGAVASESFEGFGILSNHGFAVLQVAAACAMIVLARSNWRGRNSARTKTWWLGGVMLCCPTIDAAGSIAFRSAPRDPIQQRLQHMLPSWWAPTRLVLVLLLLIALALALVLLALPSANRFFRAFAPTPLPNPSGA
ncbi:hypothetical protein ABT297_16030 [Dactylosporangium sp. NPDC000555]|uniref:hypothetical protein n=1 Tax=Dactylosporangium sp. NPDC000555 TaxID=3154260 RepID=UPI003333F95D